MRISDWSSDVCSSDLPRDRAPELPRRDAPRLAIGTGRDDRHIGVAEGGVEVIAEGVELTDHLARQMRLGDGARAQHRPERIAAAGARRSCRQAFEHRDRIGDRRSEEHTSELQSLMRISYAVFGLKKTQDQTIKTTTPSL